jgi:hypothetical protein
MKTGYKHAILELVKLHKQMVADNADPEVIKGIKEGIEFLCLPYREDVWYEGPSPLNEDDDKDVFSDRDEICRRGPIAVELSNVAFEAMTYLRSLK